MKLSNVILSYIPKGYGNIEIKSTNNGIFVYAEYHNGSSVQKKVIGRITEENGFIPNKDSVSLFHFDGKKKIVLGPYEILKNISNNLDGQLEGIFEDKAIIILAIAKVRAANDVELSELESTIQNSPFSPLFGSFDYEGFFSSLDEEKIQNFLQRYSTVACSFISDIHDIDIRNRALVEIRSKWNNLMLSSSISKFPLAWDMLNLLSLMYYSDIIEFLINKLAYASCYAYQLFNIAQNYVYYDDGLNGGKEISFASLKERKFLDSLEVFQTNYAC